MDKGLDDITHVFVRLRAEPNVWHSAEDVSSITGITTDHVALILKCIAQSSENIKARNVGGFEAFAFVDSNQE
jgi:hypothetical protein